MKQSYQKRHIFTGGTANFCRLWLCVFLVLMALPAHSQSYNTGHAMYQKGNFSGAETALKKALNSRLPKSEQARIHKLIGICQFMLGNKAAAIASFRQALSLQTNLVIAPSEVLDESVIALFNAQKRTNSRPNNTPTKLANRQTSGATTPTNSGNQPIAGAKVVKSTFLKVLSNVPNASISIDGILAGQVNNLINTDPGQIEIEVSAAGYPSKTLKVTIIKNRENTVTVNLEKPKPKPKPQPKPAPAAVANAASGKANTAKRKKPGDDDLFAPAPDAAMFPEETPRPSAAGVPGGAAAPATAAARPGAMPPPASDPAAEFAMDAATGGAGGYAPPPAFAQPAAPAYPPSAMYYAPPPTYYSPPPPPPAPMPGDPGMGQGGYEGGLPPDPAGSAQPTQTNRRGASTPRKRFLITIAPFGGGQFQNRDYIMGSALAAAELYSVYKYLSLTRQADTEVVQTNNYIVAQGGRNNLDDAQKQYVNKMTARVNSTRKQADLYLKIFLGLWGAGVIDAFTNDPPPVTKKKPPKRRRFQPLMTVNDNTSSTITGAEAAAIDRERRPAATWSLGLTPFLGPTFTAVNVAYSPPTPESVSLFSDPTPVSDTEMPREYSIGVKWNWTF